MNDWLTHIDDDHEDSVWKVQARSGRKVDAIKAFRAFHGCALKEAKAVVEEYDARRVEDERGQPTTTHVHLPAGGVLNIISNGVYTTIMYTSTEATNLLPHEVPQAIADAALKYG